MSQYGWENSFRVLSGEGECIGMTDPGRYITNEDLAFSWSFEIDFHDF